MYRTLLARCEYRVCSHCVTIIVCHFHDTHTKQGAVHFFPAQIAINNPPEKLPFRVTTQVEVVRTCHKNPVATDKTKT